MPNPKALTPEQINLLRGLPKSRDERLTTPEERGVIGLLLVTPRNTIDLLLATIDSAVTAERERVLVEVDEVFRRHDDAYTDHPSRDDDHVRGAQGAIRVLVEDIHSAANPQKDTDHE